MSKPFPEEERPRFALPLGVTFILVVVAAAATATFIDLDKPLSTATVWVFVPDLKPHPVVSPISTAIRSVLAVQAASAGHLCKTDHCAKSYLSFREVDCTFQPFEGPRRLCKK